jgi:predicted TIM-barrel enzyme
MPRFLASLKEMGFAGVQNFPTVGLIEGRLRANLEETGMGFDKEVEMIRIAGELDLLTTPYVFTVEEARAMAAADADIIVAHVGTTVAGAIGAQSVMSLDDAVAQVQALADAARTVKPDVLVLCHGGPIATVDDTRYVLERTHGLSGFYGASSMERLPVEVAIADNIRQFKALTLKP